MDKDDTQFNKLAEQISTKLAPYSFKENNIQNDISGLDKIRIWRKKILQIMQQLFWALRKQNPIYQNLHKKLKSLLEKILDIFLLCTLLA